MLPAMSERVCHFCDSPEGEGQRLFTGTRTPPAYICEECVLLLHDISREDRPVSLSRPPPALVPWTPFEFGGQALEWWAMRVNVPKKGSKLMICVRKQGDDGDGVGNLYLAGTTPSVALAEETAAKLKELL
jgi:hypothetical protein